MIQIDVTTKTVKASVNTPMNEIYTSISNAWANIQKQGMDLKPFMFPMTFNVDHSTGTVNYRMINRWKLLEV